MKLLHLILMLNTATRYYVIILWMQFFYGFNFHIVEKCFYFFLKCEKRKLIFFQKYSIGGKQLEANFLTSTRFFEILQKQLDDDIFPPIKIIG